MKNWTHRYGDLFQSIEKHRHGKKADCEIAVKFYFLAVILARSGENSAARHSA